MDAELDATALAGLLADETRLRVLAAVALGAGDVAAIAAATGIASRDAGRALARLAAAGVVSAKGRGYAVDYEQLAAAAQAAQAARPDPAAGIDVAETGGDVAAVLRRFFRNGRLTSIPVPRAKRLAVLDYLASHFEPGRVYPERDVNALLRQFHDDTAALRRYLVDEGFFERREGFYWRAGGTFEVE